MPENAALWLPAKRAPFAVGPAPYTAPRAGEIVVRARAVAINPIDWSLQRVGDIIFPWIAYPTVLGWDVAGEVAEVGPGVVRFKVGDRVIGQAMGGAKDRNSAAEGAFQTYVVVLAHMAAPIPAALSFEQAAVMPLGLSTAAAALFQQDLLALKPPTANPEPTGETVLIWGGATSVGCNAIQLAVAAGYRVATTASPRNFDYLKGLGAAEVFDYRAPSVVKALIAALKGRRLAGALAIGAGAAAQCLGILAACEGRRFVAMASPPASFAEVPAGRGRFAKLAPQMLKFVTGNIALAVKARVSRAEVKFFDAAAIAANPVGPMIYETFLPAALAEGRYRAAPEPLVAGQGLAAIPAAMELQRKGVSATKVVVTL
jgi:NADPH:quinone reductase-like Zn-dependent oxidoreductase